MNESDVLKVEGCFCVLNAIPDLAFNRPDSPALNFEDFFMHYYSFNIKDYIVHTVHLTNEQDLAYRRLLDFYYETECKISTDTGLVARRLRIGSDVVSQVLKEFFHECPDGWSNPRCDEEILAYHAKADTARKNGKLGGKPKKSRLKPIRNLSGTYPVPTSELTINHKPLTNNQENILTSSNGDIPPKTNKETFSCNLDDEVTF